MKHCSIVRPGFFMENFDGFMGSLAVAILSQGLRKETDIALVVCNILHESCYVVQLIG